VTPLERFEAACERMLAIRGLVHGSDLLDVANLAGLGTCAEQYAERWIERKIGEGALAPSHAAPTHGQLAWASLGNCAARMWSVRGPGTALGWYYSDTRHLTPDERAAHKLPPCDWCSTGYCWTHDRRGVAKCYP